MRIAVSHATYPLAFGIRLLCDAWCVILIRLIRKTAILTHQASQSKRIPL